MVTVYSPVSSLLLWVKMTMWKRKAAGVHGFQTLQWHTFIYSLETLRSDCVIGLQMEPHLVAHAHNQIGHAGSCETGIEAQNLILFFHLRIHMQPWKLRHKPRAYLMYCSGWSWKKIINCYSIEHIGEGMETFVNRSTCMFIV